MNKQPRSLILIGLGLTLLVSSVQLAPLLAQDGQKKQKPQPYVKIRVDGNFEELLKNRLRQANGLQNIKKLLKEKGLNPDQLPGNLGNLQDLLGKIDLNDPLIRRHLKDMLDKGQGGQQPFNEQKFKKLQEALKKLQFPDGKKPPGDNPLVPNNGGDGPGAKPPGVKPQQPNVDAGGGGAGAAALNPEEDEPQPDPMRDFVTSLLKEIKSSDIDDFFQDSDGFKGFLSEVEGIFSEEGLFLGLDNKDVADLFGKGDADKRAGDWSKLFKGWEAPNVTLPGAPRMTPTFPSWGSSPSMPSGGAPAPAALMSIFLVIFFVIVGGVLLWSLLKAAPWSPFNPQRQRQRQLGPWPVNPAEIRTPAELIVAFNYLAQLVCGLEAASWNHKQAAARLGDGKKETRRREASTLATIYEQARYAPAEPLSAADVHQARRCLAALAGGR